MGFQISSRVIPSVIGLLFVTGIALGGQRTGNGGDPLRLVFAKAKDDAELVLGQISPEQDIVVPVNDPVRSATVLRVQAFLSEPFGAFASRRLAMIADIHNSQHEWVYEPEDQPTCAWTNREGEDSRIIHLSVPFCRTLLTDEDGGPPQAVRQLIHESTHHVGLVSTSEEPFADAVAAVVYEAWEHKRNRSRPFWDSMSVFNGPDMRYLHSTVWTGANPTAPELNRKLIVWGGCNYAILINSEDCAHNLNSGGILDLSQGSPGTWTAVNDNGAPSPRRNHTALWTGSTSDNSIRDRMLVFGGCRGQSDTDMTCSESLRDGATYSPVSKSWSPVAPLPLEFPARVFAATGWTGQEFIQWGGLVNFDHHPLPPLSAGDGARLVFDGVPGGRWVKMDTRGAPEARFQPSVATIGRKLIVSGGCLQQGIIPCRRYANDIGIYDAELDDAGHPAWTQVRPPTNVTGRVGHSLVVVENRYLIIWGGTTPNGIAADGLIYDMLDGGWREIPALLPLHESGRTDHQAFWDAAHHRMVIWGGQYGRLKFAQTTMALEFSPDFSAYTWRSLSTDLNPIGRKGTSGIWTGDEFVIWGGFGDQFTFLDVGDILRLP